MTREKKIWLITFTIWFAGCGVIYVLWENRIFVNDTAETVFGFILYFVALFYVVAIGWIRDWVAWHLFGGRE
jgi:hypothetical protein